MEVSEQMKEGGYQVPAGHGQAEQLPGLFGLTVPKGGHLITTLYHLLGHLHQSHLITLALGILAMAVILTINKLRPAWPGTLIALVLVGLLVYIFRLDTRGVSVVGAVSRTLPPFHLPSWDGVDQLGQLASGALAIALLGLVEAVSIAKSISDQTRQRLNINREFFGQGLANLSAAFFSGYPVSGSFTRSAVNFRSGARTPFSGVLSGLAVAATVLAAAPLAGFLPIAGLAGVLLVVAYDMVHWEVIKRTIRATRADAAVLAVTFLSTLLLNIEFAVYVGVLLSIGLHLAKTSRPQIYEEIPDFSTGKMKPAALGDGCPQMDIVYIEGSIFFGSSAFVQEDLLRRLRNHPETINLLIRMHRVNTLDASGVHVLELLLEEVRRRGGICIWPASTSGFSRCSGIPAFSKNSGKRICGIPPAPLSAMPCVKPSARRSVPPAIESFFRNATNSKKAIGRSWGKGSRPGPVHCR